MSQFSAYKKQAEKHSKKSKRRDTGIDKNGLKSLTEDLGIFQDNPENSLDPVQTGSRPKPDPVQTQAAPILLTKLQRQVYQFFVDNGQSGVFNRTLVHAETGVSKATVKATILKLQKCKIIEIGPLCSIKKTQAYTLDLSITVCAGDYEPVQAPPGHIELSEFWQSSGLTLQKCGEWLAEIPGLTPERLRVQLEYGEHTEAVIKAEKGPVVYIYGCLKKSPLVKPAAYRTVEDQYAEIMQQRIDEANKKAVELRQLKERLFDAEYEAWCLENPDEIVQIHKKSMHHQRAITSPMVQAYIKGEYRKRHRQ